MQLQGSGHWGEIRQADELWDLMVQWNVSVLVMEDYILLQYNSKKRDAISPVRVTAMFDAFIWAQVEDRYTDDYKLFVKLSSAGLGGRIGELGAGNLVDDGTGAIYRKMQMPSQKLDMPDHKLKEYGLWKGLSSHERDAWRHVLICAKNAGLLIK